MKKTATNNILMQFWSVGIHFLSERNSLSHGP